MSRYMKELRRKVGKQLLEVPAVSVVTRDDHGRVLLVRHGELGTWMTPGGAIEPAETPADAAVREVWEETGLEVRLTRLAGVYGGPQFVVRYENGDETSYAMIVFEAEIQAGDDARADGVEILEVGFFAPSEIKSLEMPGWMPEILKGVLESGDGTTFDPPTWRPPAGG
jgi:8-oxo-dGTP pyrophosphatase MutT (NUDIX family)